MKYLAIIALFALALVAPAYAETAHGTWTISTERGEARLETHWSDGSGSHSNDSRDIDPQSLGIAQQLAGPSQRATFSLHREAGDFAFEGWLGNNEGSGSFTFTPNDAFFNDLTKRGYTFDSMGTKMAFATLDITMSYVNQVEALGLKGETGHLIAMKALKVTPQYVHDLQSAGVQGLEGSRIISLKALHVDSAFVNEIAAAGYPHLEANQYVTLKAMHIDGAYIKYLRDHGLKNLTINQIVSMKAQHI